MSSAILYLAIIAIWACVLIPRWLRRDSARGASAPGPAESPVPAGHAPAVGGTDIDGTDVGGTPEDRDSTAAPGTVPVQATRPPLTVAESRRRMLAARRRLLLMLIALEVAAVTLAVLGLAAVWVVIPPSIMLAGYLLLLREAAQADAERAQYQAVTAALAQDRASARARAKQLQAQQVTPPEGMPTAGAAGVADAAAALAAKFAAAPVQADYEDAGPGRDFAPGLAGKYTTSKAAADPADEDAYGTYEFPRLRAVGD
jgi:hypothetical protein